MSTLLSNQLIKMQMNSHKFYMEVLCLKFIIIEINGQIIILCMEASIKISLRTREIKENSAMIQTRLLH
jgi:hypothetical protein